MSDQTSSICTRGAVHRDGLWFRDEAERTLLRGANLSGSTKLPYTPKDRWATDDRLGAYGAGDITATRRLRGSQSRAEDLW